MKKLARLGCLVLALTILPTACGPASLPADSFAGTWTANIGTVNFTQDGDTVTGVIDGYGGAWDETFTGALNENGEAVFSTEWFGDFSLILDGDTFRSATGDTSFCGARGADVRLPDGCGFSGKWIAASNSPKEEGYMILTQTGNHVTGDFYNALGEKYGAFDGSVDWGKGWRANGTLTERGDLTLWINASETGFELLYGGGDNPNQLCAVRDGIASAHLGYFACEP